MAYFSDRLDSYADATACYTPWDDAKDATVAAMRTRLMDSLNREAEARHQAAVVAVNAEEYQMQANVWQRRYLQERQACELAKERFKVSSAAFL
jgi:hypothetical protein